ncbi:cell adhesion molecule Dscam2-like [Aulostomus maculatus]
MGKIAEGDVSLTIRQAQESDSGMYGCRVEVPGWFNDKKHQLTLTVVPVRPNPLRAEVQEVRERTVTVGWTPVFDGGRPITHYQIDLKSKQALWDTAVKTDLANADLTQVTLVDLRPAKSYNIRMFAVNSQGASNASNVLSFTTKEAAPEGPPLDMRLEALTSQSIKVTWKPPRAELRNGVLRSYSISYREYDPAGRHFKRWQHQTVTATQELESIVLSHLKPATKYGVLIQAKTNAGVGPASTAPLCSTLDEAHKTSTPATSLVTSSVTSLIEDTSNVIAVHTTAVPWSAAWEGSTTSSSSVGPDPPAVEIKEVKDNIISLVWTPGSDRGSPITGYFLEYKAVNASWDYRKMVVDFSPNRTKATIIEMNPSTYNIRMFAKNSLGTSRASNVLTFRTEETGHQRDIFSTTPSIHATVTVRESQGGRLVAIVVPVVLLVLIVAMVMPWQLRRIQQKKGSLSLWMARGAVRYTGSQPLQEL